MIALRKPTCANNNLSPAKSTDECVGGGGVGFDFDSCDGRVMQSKSAACVWQATAAVRFRTVLFGTFSFKEKVRQIWMIHLRFFVLAAPFAQMSCSLPSSSDLIVSSLRCSPSAFDSFRANTEIRYTLVKPATVTITIAQRNSSGQLILVNTLAENINETKGSHGHTWLGDTAAGLFAESGNYIAVLQIENSQYEAGVRVFHF